MEILTKNKIYEDLKQKEEELIELQEELSNRDKDIAKFKEEINRLQNEIENSYATLKTINGITKDKTIETLCILKMQDIRNISGVYVYDN